MRHANPNPRASFFEQNGPLARLVAYYSQTTPNTNRDDNGGNRYEKAYRNTRKGGRGRKGTACWRTLNVGQS
jgi:hypothetical protein